MKNIYTFLVFLILSNYAVAQTNYYYKGSGQLDVVGSWSDVSNGTGNPPTNFTSDNQIFNVINVSGTLTQNTDWIVSGSGSRIIFGDGTTSMTITFDADLYASTSGMVDVLANTKLILNGTATSGTDPGFGTLSSGSTIEYGASGNQEIATATYSNLTTSGSGTKSLVGNVTVSGTLTLNATLSIGGLNTLTFSNAIAGTITNLTTTSTSNIVINGSTACTLPGGLSMGSLTLNNSGGLTINGNITLGNSLTLTSGAFNVGANTLIVKNISGTTTNLNASSSSSISFQGTTSNFTIPSNISALTNLTINPGVGVSIVLSSSLTVSGNLTLARGTLNNTTFLTMGDGSKIIRGNGSTNGTIGSIPSAAGSYDVEYLGTGSFTTANEIPSSSTALRDFIINRGNSTATITLGKDFTANREFKITSGVLALNSKTVTINGDFVNNSGSTTSISTATSGTFAFSGGGNDITINAECSFSNITINSTGALTAPNSNNFNIRGDFVNNGNFTHNSGTVKFDGATTATLSGTSQSNFNNINIVSGKTLNGVSSGTFGVAGNFVNDGTFNGNSGTISFNGISSISGSGTNNFNNITIATSSTLTGPSNLSLAGDFTVDGTFTQGTNTVTFSGTGTQSIIGTSSNLSFYNLTLSGGSGSTRLEGCNARLLNTLTIGAGKTFDADGSGNNRIFRVVSNSGGTARIATIPSDGNLSGKITMERFTTGSRPMWTLASTPIKNATIYNWQAFFPTTGFIGSNYPNNTFVSIRFDEEAFATSINDQNRYLPPGGADDNIPVGEGLWVYMGYRDRNLVIDINGLPQVNRQTTDGAFDFGVTYSSGTSGSNDFGWNLIANPFPCEIDWLATNGWTKTNMADAIYFYDASITSGSKYRAFVNGASTSGATQFIASSQGIYVKANAPSPVLSCDERVKATNGTGPTFYKTTINEKPLVRLEMSNGSDNITETVVYFEQGASTEFDSKFDAYDLSSTPIFGDNFTFCSTNKDTKYMINGLPPLKGNTSVQMYVSVPASGTYTISAKDMEFIPQHYCIKLYDKKTDKYTNLRNGTYSFDLVENEAEESRFTLFIEENASLSFQTNIKQPVCGNSENKVEIIPNNGEVCSITVFDPSDRVIRQTNNSASGITLTNLAPGKYKVTAKNSSFCGYAEKYFTIEDVSPNFVNHYAINETCYGSNNAEIFVSPAGEGPWSYTWYDSKHRVINQTQNSNEPSKLTNIGAGNYTVEVAFPKGCAAEIPVFQITSLPQTEALFSVANETISIDKAQNVEFTNKSKHAAFYEWFVSGDETQYLCDDLTYTFPTTGTYQVTLNVYDQCGNVNSYSKNIEVTERNTDISAVSSLRLDSDITIQQVDKGAFVKFDYSDNSDAVISICNTLGQELTSPTKVKVQGQNVYLDLKSYGNQVLFITITSSEKRITKKIVNY